MKRMIALMVLLNFGAMTSCSLSETEDVYPSTTSVTIHDQKSDVEGEDDPCKGDCS